MTSASDSTAVTRSGEAGHEQPGAVGGLGELRVEMTESTKPNRVHHGGSACHRGHDLDRRPAPTVRSPSPA